MRFRCLGRYAAVLTLAALLGACETPLEPGASEAVPARDGGSAVPDTGDAGGDAGGEPAPEAAPGPAIETGATAAEVALLPPEPAPPEPVIDDDPQQLYGLGPTALGELLGQPSLIRTEIPAKIWQYRSQTCVFDIFLYEEAGESRVTYIEARDGAAAQIEVRYCLNELLRARKGLPLG